jgi:hypothetical protein
VAVEWFLDNQEIAPNGYLRYENISDLLCDVYDKEYVYKNISMAMLEAVIATYIL